MTLPYAGRNAGIACGLWGRAAATLRALIRLVIGTWVLALTIGVSAVPAQGAAGFAPAATVLPERSSLVRHDRARLVLECRARRECRGRVQLATACTVQPAFFRDCRSPIGQARYRVEAGRRRSVEIDRTIGERDTSAEAEAVTLTAIAYGTRRRGTFTRGRRRAVRLRAPRSLARPEVPVGVRAVYRSSRATTRVLVDGRLSTTVARLELAGRPVDLHRDRFAPFSVPAGSFAPGGSQFHGVGRSDAEAPQVGETLPYRLTTCSGDACTTVEGRIRVERDPIDDAPICMLPVLGVGELLR